ncbi:MAG: class I SAM-dependent methyltransferase [Pseudomonadota bacterium]
MTALDDYLPAYKRDFAYQFDNEIMLNWYAKRIVELTSPNSSALELGVGHGYSCDLFSKYYSKYRVIDGSSAVIENYKQAFPASIIEIVESYFEDYDHSEKFDIIIMGFVLEHVDSPAAILAKYRTLLKPGGVCFVAVPNAESLHRRFAHAAGLMDDMASLSESDRLLGHKRYYTARFLAETMEEAGYRVVRKEGIFLKSLTTRQLTSLNLSPEILQGMCRVAIDYPELSAGLLFEGGAAE